MTADRNEPISAVYYSLHGSNRLYNVASLAAAKNVRPSREVAEMIADLTAAMMPGVANVKIASVLVAAARLTTDAFLTAQAESLRVLDGATGENEADPLERMERALDETTGVE